MTHHGHALVTLYVHFLCSDWSKLVYVQNFQHLETCLLMAKVDRVLYHLAMFLTVFFHWMYKMKYSCFQEYSCCSCLVCLLGFWLRNTPLVKVIGNPISDGILFTLLDVALDSSKMIVIVSVYI